MSALPVDRALFTVAFCCSAEGSFGDKDIAAADKNWQSSLQAHVAMPIYASRGTREKMLSVFEIRPVGKVRVVLLL